VGLRLVLTGETITNTEERIGWVRAKEAEYGYGYYER
jgi:hypothetical protein